MVETTIKFNYYTLDFTPLKGSRYQNTKDILNQVITYVTPRNLENKVHLIDRHKDRKDEAARELFINYAVIIPRSRRIKCSIALLRSGKPPMLKPKDEFRLVPLNAIDVGSLADVTHFYIDYSKEKVVLCVEYNYHGPRINDIEYYLRNVAKEVLNLSRKTSVQVFMDVPLDDVLENMANVLSFDIKIEPHKISKIQSDIKNRYFTGLNTFSSLVKPRFLKINALFQVQGGGGTTTLPRTVNSDANTFIKKIFSSIKFNHTDIDTFDNFYLEYETQDDEVKNINLLKGQKSFEITVDLNKMTTNTVWYETIEKEFTRFIDEL